MKSINQISLARRFFISPLFNIILMGLLVLFSVSQFERQSQMADVTHRKIDIIEKLSQYVFSLSYNHIQVQGLLDKTAQGGIPEEEVYVEGKPLLGNIHRLHDEIEAVTRSLDLDETVTVALLKELYDYKEMIITSIGMAVVDRSLSKTYLEMTALSYAELNNLISQYVNLAHLEIENGFEIRKQQHKQELIRYLLGFVFVVLLSMLVNLILARVMSEDITQMIGRLHSLGDNGGKADLSGKMQQNELERLNESIIAFEQVLRQLNQYKNELEIANRAKSSFLTHMSHEFRTPLNAILGFSQILEAEALNSEQKEYVDLIQKGGYHLLKLVENILDLTGIESGQLIMCIESVCIKGLLNDCINVSKELALEHSVGLEQKIALADDFCIQACDRHLRKALSNLLDNAIRYNKEHGQVLVSARVDTSNLEIKIEDTGIGIDEENLERLFKPFSRVEYNERSSDGLGIGLVLSKNLLEKMGGSIHVESRKGEGSCFEIRFKTGEATL